MGQIVLWDDFSHKGNKSLIAICDFISHTGEYIKHNGLPHPKGCSPAVFKGVSVHTARKSPPTLPILQDLVREAPPHAKGTTPSKYLGLQTDGEFVKGSACWPQQPPSLQICQRRRSKWLVSLNRGGTNSCSSGNAGPVWTYQEFEEAVNGNSLSSYLILYL